LPKNLDEAVLYFQQNWTTKELNDFKKRTESNAVIKLHFGTGLWIRNNWVRGKRDTALTNYFHSFGISNPDDISIIILTSLHRKLNNKSVNLDKQVEKCKAYWKPIIECKEKVKVTALLNYNKYKVSDSISIYMPVDENRNAVIYECPDISWKFKDNKDLLIKGQIVRKYYINDTSNVFFTLKITSINRTDIQVLMTPIKVGDNKEFSLRGLKLD